LGRAKETLVLMFHSALAADEFLAELWRRGFSIVPRKPE
jgi:hypothetical protein